MDGVKTSNPVCSICHETRRTVDDDETRVEGDEATLGFKPPYLLPPPKNSVCVYRRECFSDATGH